MKTNAILLKVYRLCQAVIVMPLLAACLLLHWEPSMMLIVVLASAIMSVPPVLSLHLLVWIVRRLRIAKAFAWMLLFACIPLMALGAVLFTADALPGGPGVLLALGMISSYAGILANGLSISQLFNPTA